MSVDRRASPAGARPSPGEDLPPTRAARRQEDAAVPRFYRRVLLAVILPGAGLLRTRWRLVGAVVLLAFLGAVGYAGWRVVEDGVVRSALGVAVDPDALRLLGVVVVAVALVWAATIVLTAGQHWPRRRRGRVLRVLVTVVACLAVAAPAGVAVRYLEVQAALVDDVVVAGPGGQAGGRSEWEGTARVNTLLIGSDAGKGRTGVRTDSMMVASIDPRSGDTLLIGIPRNLENVPFPESNPLHERWPNGYDCGDECLMNGVWTLAVDNADLFPDDPSPGLTTTVDVVGEITGLDIDRSVVVDLKGFEALVDAMGGVEVNVTQRVCVGCSQRSDGSIRWTTGKKEWIEPGLQRLDGRGALWYSRSRAGSDDFNRMRRQRCVAGALIEQADPVSLLARYPQIAGALRDNLEVQLPEGELAAWVDLVLRVQDGDGIRSLPLTSDVVPPANPDFDEIRELVEDSLDRAGESSASPSASASASSDPDPEPSPSSSSSPSVAPDDEAADLSRTC
ncbi:MAG: LCP family protein [Dermatophilaceae bacterium]